MDINQKITEELGVKRRQVDAAVRLIDEGRINEAENRLCDYLDQGSGSREELAAALGFYDHLSGCSEDFLEEHDYSREEIYDGLRELAARFGVTGLDIRM